MSQDSILSILRKHRGVWFDRKKLNSKIKLGRPSLVKNMSQIVKFKDFHKVDVKRGKTNKFLIRLP